MEAPRKLWVAAAPGSDKSKSARVTHLIDICALAFAFTIDVITFPILRSVCAVFESKALSLALFELLGGRYEADLTLLGQQRNPQPAAVGLRACSLFRNQSISSVICISYQSQFPFKTNLTIFGTQLPK